MRDITFTSAKITASPDSNAWSQIYSAGSLFALVAFVKKQETDTEKDLSSFGKDVFKTLEEEYFTLEERNLENIKKAVSVAIQSVPQETIYGIVIGAIIQDILYVFATGKAHALLFREDRIGSILPPKESHELLSASGKLRGLDTLIFTTNSFLDHVSKNKLKEALSSGTIHDVAEQFTPEIHKETDGTASAVFISVHEATTENPAVTAISVKDEVDEPQQPEQTRPDEDLPHAPQAHSSAQHEAPRMSLQEKKPTFHLPFSLPRFHSLNHTRKLILSIIVILILVLAFSVFFAIKKQHDAKEQALFNQVYPQAQKKYQDGEVLLSLNKPLAHDNLVQAQQLLVTNQHTFSQNSQDAQKINSLLRQVNAALAQAGGAATASSAQKDNNALFQAENDAHGTAVTQISGTSYVLVSDGIDSVTNGTSKQVVKSSGSWAGLGSYGTNLYTLDAKNNQVLKLTPTTSGYTPVNYLTDKVDFSSAVSLTNDTSIYVLFKDGSVEQFLKGAKQNFAVKGYNKQVSRLTKIYTTQDDSNLYVLDSGTGTVIVYDKTSGNYQTSYTTPELKGATDMLADETASKIFFLSAGSIYSIKLK